MATLILNLGIRLGSVVLHAPAALPPGKEVRCLSKTSLGG
jgi:hypothetical protein